MEDSKTNYGYIYGCDDYLNYLVLADGKLHTEDGYTFQIHRMLLYKSSSYFQALLFSEATERKEFCIPGISGEILSDILCYIYTGNVTFSDKNVVDLLIAADYLLLDKLLQDIETYVQNNITLENCVPIFLAAHKTSNEDLQRETFRFIQMHFETIIHNHGYGFTELPLEILKQFFISKSLNIASEKTLWTTIVKWVQKDVQRQAYVPDLLTYLEKGELDENLAKDIMEHSIVANNLFCEDLHLQKSEVSSKEYLNVLLQFLQSKSRCTMDTCKYRIPPRIYTIAVLRGHGSDREYSDIYVTYDDNLDFWRKITNIDFHPDFLLAIEHEIFMFGCEADTCLVYDLKAKTTIQVEEDIFTDQRYNVEKALNIEHEIYMLQYPFDQASQRHMYYIEIYDTVNNTSIHEMPLPDITYADITLTSKKCYLLGRNRDMRSMTVQMYDSASGTWSVLPSPTCVRYDFAFISFHERLYAIGGSTEIGGGFLKNAEMFDPVKNVWTDLPELPFAYKSPHAVVLNDNIFVYDNVRNNKTCSVYWNETKLIWEKLNEKELSKELYMYRFGLMENAESIRFLLKENRNSKSEFKESPFYLKEIFTKKKRL